jgi:hypothetical protein
MVIHLETVQPGLSPRSVYIGDSKSGDIWKSLEWKKIMSGYLTKGFFKD